MAETTERFGVLTDEAIERSRRRIGVPQPLPNPPHNFEVTWDSSRHFAFGYGDDNPLYCDPEYGKNTRWGALIAPPTFLYTMGEDAAPKPDPETKASLTGDPFAGLGSYQAVMEFEFWRPFVLGDRARCLRTQVGVVSKPSQFGERTAHVTHDFLYADGHGQPGAFKIAARIRAKAPGLYPANTLNIPDTVQRLRDRLARQVLPGAATVSGNGSR